MTYLIQNLIQLPHLTVGRRHLALTRMLQRAPSAPKPGAHTIAMVLPRAIAEQESAKTVLKSWARARDVVAIHDSGARELHLDVSRAVVALVSAAEGLRDGGEPELALLAEHLLQTQFPGGVRGNTGLPWVDQLLDLQSILAALATPDYAEHRAKLPLEPQIARIAKLTPLFGAKLAHPERVTWEIARDAEAAAESAFLGVIAVVCGAFYQDSEPDVAARKLLLEPVFDEIEMLAALRASRRATPQATPEPDPPASDAQAALADDLTLDEDPPALAG